MEECMKISVILPVYNVAEYLSHCLDSILNNTYKSLEIICVNDGSTDHSLKILNEYAGLDDRVVVISQENKGQGEARNTGLKAATGDYISFIDPDDWITENAYEIIVEEIKRSNPDILQFRYKRYIEALQSYTESGLERKYKKRYHLDIEHGEFYGFNDFDKKDFLNFKGSSCNKVYKREFLIANNIYFLPHKRGEDTLFIITCLLFTDKIYLLHKSLYFYRIRPASITTANRSYDPRYIIEQIEYLDLILHRRNIYNTLKKELSRYKVRAIYEGDKNCSAEYKDQFYHYS